MSDPFDFDTPVNRRAVPALKVHSLVLGDDGMDLFAAGVADMDFRAPPLVVDAMKHRAEHGVFGYETVPTDLIPALTQWYQARHGWAIDADQILRAPNVLNSLSMAVNLFSDAGDKIIIQPPVFFDFADIISENGRRLAENPLILKDGRYSMDFDGLETLASDPSAKILLLCNPHNPVGRVWTKAELTRLGAICRDNNVLVVSDEIHGDITFVDHRYTPFASLSAADALNSITCLSPAKSFNIAACCGAFTVVPDPARRDLFKAENSRLTVNKNNGFASVAMTAAYRSGGPWLDAANAYIARNLALVRSRVESIPQVRLIEPEGTFLLWLDFRALDLGPDALTQFLRQNAKWAITRGIAFGESGAGFGRLNIACTRAALSVAMDSLAAAIHTYSNEKT